MPAPRCYARTAGNAKRVAAFAHLLAIHIAEKYTNIASQRPDYRGGLPIARLRKIEDYVRAHLAESISIETLAELAELSPFHFSRVFKQTTGMTPLAISDFRDQRPINLAMFRDSFHRI